jgi:Ca2+-binding EF-hand superfamily protein
MENLGLEASKAELANMVNEIDIRGTGEIDFESTFQLYQHRKNL